jgi:hypothetical protein
MFHLADVTWSIGAENIQFLFLLGLEDINTYFDGPSQTDNHVVFPYLPRPA